MAFFPAHCDNHCKDCEKNSCGWCTWKDKATPYYDPKQFILTCNKEERTEEESTYLQPRTIE